MGFLGIAVALLGRLHPVGIGVAALVLTHGDPDHIGGAPAMPAATPSTASKAMTPSPRKPGSIRCARAGSA